MRDPQKRLDFDRGEQLALRAEVDLPPGEKFVLWALDDIIRGTPSWAIHVERLQALTGYKKSAVYNFIRSLKERALIDWDDLPDRSKRFRISWQNIAELVHEQNGVGYGVDSVRSPPGGTDFPPDGHSVHHVESDSTEWKDFPPDGNSFPPRGKSVHHVESIYRNNRPTFVQEPSINTASSSELEELVTMVAECGVGRAGDCVVQAIEHGMTPEAIRAVVNHHRDPANVGRWHAGILFERLTRLGAYAIPPDEGWYGDAADWSAAQAKASETTARMTPEIRWGPVLDDMDAVAVAALADRLPVRDRQWISGRLAHGWSGHDETTREVRKLLLEQLARELAPDHFIFIEKAKR